MRSFFEWYASAGLPSDQRWLVLGKGPSFARRGEFDLTPFRTVSLNHAVREQPVDVAHIIDADVVDHLGEDLFRNAGVVVMPWRPHVKNDPGPEDLGQLAERHPLLRRLAEAGRLLWYNLSSGKPRPGSPIVIARFFSAEAAIHLLTHCGVRTIRSLGIDGGAAYSAAFHDLNDTTLLANGRQSFDKQFEQIARTIAATGVDFAPLDVPSPLPVYVRHAPHQTLAGLVLASAVRRRTSLTTIVTPITGATARDTTARRQQLRELARQHGAGRCITLDASMLLLRDLRPLWYLPQQGAAALGVHRAERAEHAVAVLDASAVHAADDDACWPGAIAECYHTIDRVDDHTAVVEFRDETTQPWLSRQHPHGALWCADLLEAIAAGHVQRADVEQAVARRHARPSLLVQVDRKLADPAALPPEALRRDHGLLTPSGVLVPQPPGEPRARWRATWERTGLPALPGRLKDRVARWLGRAPYA